MRNGNSLGLAASSTRLLDLVTSGGFLFVALLLPACAQVLAPTVPSTANSTVIETLQNPASLVSAALSGPAGSAASLWGANSAGGQYGQFIYSGSASPASLAYQPSAIPASWFDVMYFPDDSNLSFILSSVSEVSVDIHQQLGSPGQGSSCGLGLAFGNASGHPNAAHASKNMRLEGRDWNTSTNSSHTARDLIRISYQAGGSPITEGIFIDPLINDFNLASGNSWNNVQFSSTHAQFSMQRGAMTGAHVGDALSYRFTLKFDPVAHTITTTISPPSTSSTAFQATINGAPGDTSTWQTQSAVWKLTNPTSTVDPSGDNRGGLDLSHVAGASYGFSDFEKEPVSIGFLNNLNANGCTFTHMTISNSN